MYYERPTEQTWLLDWMCPVGIGVSHLSKTPTVSNGVRKKFSNKLFSSRKILLLVV